MDKDAFYNSPEWRAAREQARVRDGNRCSVARLIGGDCSARLDVHHLQSVEERPDLVLDLDNLLTTCGRHHPQVEAIRRALRLKRGIDLPRCPHRHPTRAGRLECDRRRRRAREERRLGRLAA